MSAQIHVSLTVDERDAIDAAKGRIRRTAAVISAVLNADDVDQAADWYDEAHVGLMDLADQIREDVRAIDEAFTSADARRIDGGQKRGSK